MAIEVEALSKTYGSVGAVEGLSFVAPAGKVTGFLGPNGAGKSTTMRMILGLDHPTSGRATIGGRAFAGYPNPVREVGALLDAGNAPARMKARTHLRWIAEAAQISPDRVDNVLELVGLASARHRRIGTYSLGMRQRLGIATAILGDPETLLLDEPVNGLDPDGIRWMRALLRGMADEGRTVLVSSHLMSETQQIADQIVVIAQGRLIADMPTNELLMSMPSAVVRVRCSDPDLLAKSVNRRGGSVFRGDPTNDDLTIQGISPETIGELASDQQIAIYLLAPASGGLEEAFIQLTKSPERSGKGAK